MISLSQKQSNAWYYLSDDSTNEILYGGGAGSGKSYLGCIWHITRRTTYPGTRGMIGRSKISILEQSTLVTLFRAAKDLGYEAGTHYTYNSQKHVINWVNGSTTILKDLFFYPSDPDFTSLGSTEYTDVFIDEVNEITQKAFEISSSRIRYMLNEFGLVPKILMTCNPSPGWVKERYVIADNKKVDLQPHQKFVQALVTDNPDKSFVDLYKKQLERLTNDYDKARLLYGDWETERDVENPFAHAYNKAEHEHILVKHDPQKQLIISIDFNIDPFGVIFAHIFRDRFGEHCYVFDEFSIKNGSIPLMVDRIKEKYGPYLPGCMVTGDAMGKNRNISERDNASNYEQLRRGLGISQTQLKLPANPTHQNSRADLNYILVHFPDFKINPETCPNLVRDMKIVQCDAFGSIIKRNRSDISQLADHLDCVRYLFNTFLKSWIIADMKKHTARK